jgi:superoxide reductase
MTRLDPIGKPEADFTVSINERPVAVYEYCNLHGLWVKEF